jgi:HTH-type transcriptional regulator/antitoxin HigA
MKATRKPLRYEQLPKDYAGLLDLLVPRPIRDNVDLENVTEVADALAGHILTQDQSDYFDLLCSLIETFDREHVTPPRVSGLDALRHLLKEHGMSAADLSRLLHTHRTLGAMILRGERNLTVPHLRILSKHFGVSMELFATE